MSTDKARILIASPAHEVLIKRFAESGFEVLYLPEIEYEELLKIISTVTGLVVTTRIKLDRNILEKGDNLKWIGRLGSGMELIDVEFAKEKGIKCISTPEGNRNAVAEHTLALLLNLLNKVSKSFEEVKNGIWLRGENKGTELTGKTVGIIGYGNTGSTFAKLLQPFNVTVLAYDKYKFDFAKEYIKEVNLGEICRYANIISMHLPLSAETKHLANADFFNCLQQKPFFVTTCRGAVTDTAALVAALQNGQVAGAALDVLENEKFASYNESEKQQFNFLKSQPNVILTPHIAGYSNEAFLKMAEVLLQKLGL